MSREGEEKMKSLAKKMMVMLVLAVSVFALAGCGGSKESGTSKNTSGSSENSEKLTVGLIQMADNGAFTDMREGFIQQLRDKGYDESKLEVIAKNAQGDATNLNTIVQDMVSRNVDLIATIGTPATQAVVNIGSEIPVVFISVSDPVGAGIITSMDKPDKNATGTSNAIPVNQIFDLADKLTPGNKTYGVMYNTSEVNAENTAKAAMKYLDSIGLNYVESVVTNSSEIQAATETLVGKVDAIFIPNDAMIQSAMPLVAQVAREAKIPVYGSSAVMVASGAFATIAISDTEIGAISADKAIENLEGKAIAEIPAVVVEANQTVVNKTTLEALGIKLTEDISSGIQLVEDAK